MYFVFQILTKTVCLPSYKQGLQKLKQVSKSLQWTLLFLFHFYFATRPFIGQFYFSCWYHYDWFVWRNAPINFLMAEDDLVSPGLSEVVDKSSVISRCLHSSSQDCMDESHWLLEPSLISRYQAHACILSTLMMRDWLVCGWRSVHRQELVHGDCCSLWCCGWRCSESREDVLCRLELQTIVQLCLWTVILEIILNIILHWNYW